MIIVKYLLVIAVLLSFTAPAKADGHGILTLGLVDCGKWLEARVADDKGHSFEFQRGLVGYLDGLAVGKGTNFWVAEREVTPDQVAYWMDKYCRETPLSTIRKGADILFHERTGVYP